LLTRLRHADHRAANDRASTRAAAPAAIATSTAARRVSSGRRGRRRASTAVFTRSPQGAAGRPRLILRQAPGLPQARYFAAEQCPPSADDADPAPETMAWRTNADHPGG
jgi:hypothetical protein